MRRDETRRTRPLGVTWAFLALALAACDGPNQFSTPLPTGTAADTEAPEVDIRLPRGDSITAKPLGESIEIHAFVDDDIGVDSVLFIGVDHRGDPELGTDSIVVRYLPKSVSLNQARDTVIRRFLDPTEDLSRDTATIYVQVWDAEGNSDLDSVRVVLGGPDVRLLNLDDGQSVQSGLTLSLQLQAFDPTGLTRVQFDLGGVVEQSFVMLVAPPSDSVRFDTIVAIPGGSQGSLTVAARGRNESGLEGVDGPIDLNVVLGGAGDTIAPTPRLDASSAPFLELQDSVLVVVSGSDDDQGGGVAKIGYTLLATSAARGDTITSDSVVFTSPRTGAVSQTFSVPIVRVDSLSLPDTLDYELTAFMVDAAGNCAAAIDDSSTRQVCGTNGPFRVAATRRGMVVRFSVVAGRTIQLPSGGRIMDAVVDTTRRNLMLSNIDRDRVEVFRLDSETFLQPVAVGAEPWGLALNRPAAGGKPDTLLVANSGGTNITNIYLGPDIGTGPFIEDPVRRFLTPDVVLFDVESSEDQFGFLRYRAFFVPSDEQPSFSDRPQFMAVDSTGRILYSTKTTPVGDFGTLRKAFIPGGVDLLDPDLRPEVQIFFEHAALQEADAFTAIGNIDHVAVLRGTLTDEVILTDHEPGFPDRTITGGPSLLGAALLEIAGKGSDVVAGAGRFSVANLGFTDTTFVSASGDGGWVVFGEGVIEPVGRIIMYEAENDRVSAVIPVTDQMTNASETVRGIGLNYDGTLGVARGFQAYFFTTDLRLQGVADLPAGGAGAVLHPLHADAKSLSNPGGEYRPDTHLAFLGTGERTIEIIDTFHFFLSGRIFIRDAVSGPLRAVLPFGEDNLGLQCQSSPITDQVGNLIGEAVEVFANGDFNFPHPAAGGTPSEDRCIVVKLFGITDSGGVVVVNVRKGDILRNHPGRQEN